MKVGDIANATELRPLKVPAREVPHAVIEPNYTCNRRCAACYNLRRDGVKSFEQVTAEIDLAVSKRNLETISILGGEPTLHPRLPDIVRYVKSKNLVCQVLTNGLALLEDSQDRLLDELLQTGLDRIVLHVDCGQGLDASEVERMRQVLFEKFESRALYFGLAITLYRQNMDEIPGLMKRYARFRFFDGVLGTVVRASSPDVPENVATMPDLAHIYSAVTHGLRIQPASYLPSSLDDREVRWLIYFYYLNARTGATAAISPRFARLLRRACRLVTGRHLFAATLKPSLFGLWLFFCAITESLLKPSRLPEFIRLAIDSSGFNQLRFHYIVLQAAPQPDTERHSIEICYHCPDATIRNGRLTPVCLADWLGAAGLGPAKLRGKAALAETVYAHLEDAA